MTPPPQPGVVLRSRLSVIDCAEYQRSTVSWTASGPRQSSARWRALVSVWSRDLAHARACVCACSSVPQETFRHHSLMQYMRLSYPYPWGQLGVARPMGTPCLHPLVPPMPLISIGCYPDQSCRSSQPPISLCSTRGPPPHHHPSLPTPVVIIPALDLSPMNLIINPRRAMSSPIHTPKGKVKGNYVSK